MSGNQLKQKNQSSLGPSVVIFLFKFKGNAPWNAEGLRGAVTWSSGRVWELCVCVRECVSVCECVCVNVFLCVCARVSVHVCRSVSVS